MPRRDPDRALRRLVADLARLHPDDSEAILDALDPAERARLDRLVAGVPEPAAEEAAWRYEGLSPWLLERLELGASGADRRPATFALMTPAASEALRAAAEPFRTQAAAGERRGPPLLSRAMNWLSGARA